jgi:hypothetical protein
MTNYKWRKMLYEIELPPSLGHVDLDMRERIYNAVRQAATVVEQEPVRYEFNWKKDQSEWYGWGECNKELYERYTNNPFYFDGFEYQARALYTHPQPKRESVTDKEISDIFYNLLPDDKVEATNYTSFKIGFKKAMELLNG